MGAGSHGGCQVDAKTVAPATGAPAAEVTEPNAIAAGKGKTQAHVSVAKMHAPRVPATANPTR